MSANEQAALRVAHQTGHPRRGWFRWAALAVSLLVIGGLVGWAASVVLAPPRDVVDDSQFAVAQVTQGQVESVMNYNTIAGWTTEPLAANLSSGTVTSVNVSPGQEVTHGTTLYTVNLRPVAIAQGAIPAFRSLQQGDSGPDVAQLQQFLVAVGVFSSEVDGDFDYGTVQAVRAWQELVGIQEDGVIQVGDLIYVPQLPARIALDVEKVRVGAILSAGDQLVLGLPSSPSFKIPLTSNQAALVPVGTRVEITGPGNEQWSARALELRNVEGGVDLTLEPSEGAESICGAECGAIPVVGEVSLRSRVVIVEAVAGLTVPSAALKTRIDGQLVVLDVEGIEHPVTVVASAKGVSIVEGVPEGMRVRIPEAE